MGTFVKGIVTFRWHIFQYFFYYTHKRLIREVGLVSNPDQTRAELRTLDISPNIFTFLLTHLHENSLTINVKHKLPWGYLVTCGIQDGFSLLLQQLRIIPEKV